MMKKDSSVRIQPQTIKKLLHVGCGYPAPHRLPAFFQQPDWQEIRLDIDPQVQPDMIGSITDLSAIPNASIDAIWSSHNIEHVHSFEVPQALAELRRVLKPDGFLLMTLPNLRAIALHIANDRLTDTLYVSPVGPITALDVVFGHQASIANGNSYMAHKTGFTAKTLGLALQNAEFAETRVIEGTRLDLWTIATMPQTDPTIFDALAEVML